MSASVATAGGAFVASVLERRCIRLVSRRVGLGALWREMRGFEEGW